MIRERARSRFYWTNKKTKFVNRLSSDGKCYRLIRNSFTLKHQIFQWYSMVNLCINDGIYNHLTDCVLCIVYYPHTHNKMIRVIVNKMFYFAWNILYIFRCFRINSLIDAMGSSNFLGKFNFLFKIWTIRFFKIKDLEMIWLVYENFVCFFFIIQIGSLRKLGENEKKKPGCSSIKFFVCSEILLLFFLCVKNMQTSYVWLHRLNCSHGVCV